MLFCSVHGRVAEAGVVRSHKLDVTEYAHQAIRAAWVLSESVRERDSFVERHSSSFGSEHVIIRQTTRRGSCLLCYAATHNAY